MRNHAPKIWLVLFPLLEFLSLRVFLHRTLGVRIGFRNMTDKDILLPGIFAFAILLFVLDRWKPLLFKVRKKTLFAHLVLFAGVFILALQFETLRSQYANAFLVLWLALALITFITGIFSWVSPRYLFSHPNRELYIAIYLLAASKFLATHAFKYLAPYLQKITAESTALLSGLFSSSIKITMLQLGKDQFFQIAHPLHTISVGIGCNGLEGISLFLFTLLVTWALNPERFSVLHWLLLSFTGSLLMGLVNIVRLLVVFFLPILFVKVFGPLPSGVRILLAQLHDFWGWSFYLLAIFSFYRVALKDINIRSLLFPERTPLVEQ